MKWLPWNDNIQETGQDYYSKTMKTVKEIQDFFLGRKDDKEMSLGDLMNTVPGYICGKDETGFEQCNWTLAQEYYHI